MTGDGETDSAMSGATPVTIQSSLITTTINETVAHYTNTSTPTPQPAVSVQGFVARPVNPLDKSMSRFTMIPVVRTTETKSSTGPALNATGNDVNMSTVLIQTETIPPV